jgi:hypothetical protein
MTNVLALNRVLPAISIQTESLAQVAGWQPDNILDLLVPPAGWLEPAVDATALLTFALVEAGHARTVAKATAADLARELLARLPPERRPVMLEYIATETRVCAAVGDVIRPLFAFGAREAAVAEDLALLADAAACGPAFEGGELGQNARSLRELGPEPLQSGLAEFWPCIGWDLAWVLSEDGRTPAEGRMQAWMEGMRPEIEVLEATVGTRLFHFAEPGDERDHDRGHRFLALDYVCHMIPDSDFVDYLVEVSGAPSVEALRAALRTPAAYSPDFRLYDFFMGGPEALMQRFHMRAPDVRR